MFLIKITSKEWFFQNEHYIKIYVANFGQKLTIFGNKVDFLCYSIRYEGKVVTILPSKYLKLQY